MPENTSRLSQLAKDLSPSTGVLAKLLKALNDEEVLFNHLATIVESDTVLAGRVLHAANSGLLGRIQRIHSVPHAISLLGSKRVQNIALTLSVLSVWGQLKYPWWWSQKKFNNHSLATAAFCDLLALSVPTNNADSAFVAGLLHGLGKLAFVLLCPKELARVFPGLDDAVMERCFDEIQVDVLGCSYAEAGAQIAAEWCLPAEIQTAIARQGLDPIEPRQTFELEHILVVGHEAVGRLSLGCLLCRPRQDEPVSTFLADLGVKNADQFTARFEESFQHLSID